MSPEPAALRVVLLALAPLVAAVGGASLAGAVGAAGLLLGAALLERAPREGRLAVTGGLIAALAGWISAHLQDPASALVWLLWACALALRVWPSSGTPVHSGSRSAVRWVTSGVAVAWLTSLDADPIALVLLALSTLIAAALSGKGARAVVAMLTASGLIGWLLMAPAIQPSSAALIAALSWLLTAWSRPGTIRQMLSLLLGSPARQLVLSFLGLCLLGTALLALPAADTAGQGHALLDAAFTAVSAVCVTGLAVLDTPGDLTLVGQLFLAGLIQVGGLGIMTFTAAVLLGLGERLTLREEAVAAGQLGASARADLPAALLRVFLVTLCAELAGAGLLAVMFWAGGDPLLVALWRALFTAISAFCNAGFALQSDSLVTYQSSPLILLTISAIITAGSLGPAAVLVLPAWLRGRRVPLQVHLGLAASLLLVLAPAGLFLALEWGNTLGGMGLVDKLANAWFQSVTLRTAGFNSVDLAAVLPPTLVVMLVAMFVGGSPGSTAGGIKTTTAAVLVLAVTAAARGRTFAIARRRRIPHRTVYKAAAITLVAMFSVAGALFALLLTQPIPLDSALFEVVSALATVGLTVGATGELDDVGKIIIMLCMFAGRVGPLTVFIFLTERTGPPPVRYPEEGVAVG